MYTNTAIYAPESGGGGFDPAAYVIIVDTTATGGGTTSSSNQYTVGTLGAGYNYDIITDDGQTFTSQTGNRTITFAVSGLHTIQITGTFPRFLNYGSPDKNKTIEIVQWGDTGITTLANTFEGASRITSFPSSPSPGPVLTGVTSCRLGFRDTDAVVSIDFSNWDTSTITTFHNMFPLCAALTSIDITGWDMNGVTDVEFFFGGNGNLQSIEGVWDWDLSTISNSGLFMGDADFTTAQYNRLLIEWDATWKTTALSKNWAFGQSRYSASSAASTARAALITAGWTITDGGAI